MIWIDIPQTRERVKFVGVNSNEELKQAEENKPSLTLSRYRKRHVWSRSWGPVDLASPSRVYRETNMDRGEERRQNWKMKGRNQRRERLG